MEHEPTADQNMPDIPDKKPLEFDCGVTFSGAERGFHYFILFTSVTQTVHYVSLNILTSLYLARHSALHRVLLLPSSFSSTGLLWQ